MGVRFATQDGFLTAVDGISFEVDRGKTLGIVVALVFLNSRENELAEREVYAPTKSGLLPAALGTSLTSGASSMAAAHHPRLPR